MKIDNGRIDTFYIATLTLKNHRAHLKTIVSACRRDAMRSPKGRGDLGILILQKALIIIVMNFKQNLSLFLLVSFIFCKPSIAAETDSLWRFWDIDDGLKESFVRSISLSHEGNLLAVHRHFNTVSYMDGWDVREISLPGDSNFVKENPSGRIWTILPEGLFLLEDSEWRRFSLPFEVDGETPFVPLDRDTILLLLQERFLKFDVRTQTVSTIRNSSDGEIGRFVEIVADKDGVVWIGAEKGIAEWKPYSGDEWIEHRVDHQGFRNARELVVGSQGELFCVCTSQETGILSLLHFDGASWDVLCADKYLKRGWPKWDSGFFAHIGSKIWIYENNDRESVEKKSVLSGKIRDIAFGEQGEYWVATTQGIAKYAPNMWSKPNYRYSDLSKLVQSIHEDSQGRLWIACKNSFFFFHKDRWTIFYYPNETDPRYENPKAIHSLADGRIVLNLKHVNHVVLFNPENESFETIQHPAGWEVELITSLDDGTVVAHTKKENHSRLEKFDKNGFHDYLDMGQHPIFEHLRYVHQSQDKEIWIGGTTGLFLYQDGVLQETTYPGESALCVHELKNGRIWVGDMNRIYEYDGASWKIVRENTGPVRLMMTDKDGSDWIASGKGLYQVKENTWNHYTQAEGMPSNIVYTVFEDSQERIWAGTTLGLSFMNPIVDTDPPNTLVSKEKNLTRFAPNSEIRILFDGIDRWKHTLSERLLYSCRIDESEWTPFLEDASVTFASLPPGIHSIETRAMDRNWNVDTTPAIFEFTVLLPWYREPVFMGTVFLLVVLSITLSIMAIFHTARREKILRELLDSQNQVETLQGLLPICSHCKKIRDDHGYWNQLEIYLKMHSEITFSHGICPDCLKEHYPNQYEIVMKNLEKNL